jgi:hypothetical protein
MSQMSQEEIAEVSAKWLAQIYERTGLQPPLPPNVESPAELLQYWAHLSPIDRGNLVKYARFLSADDAPELFATVLRHAASDIYEEILVYARGARLGLLGPEEQARYMQQQQEDRS